MQIETEKRKNVLSYLVRNGKHPPYFRRHHASGHVILDCAFSVWWDTSTGCHITIQRWAQKAKVGTTRYFWAKVFLKSERAVLECRYARSKTETQEIFLEWNVKTSLPHWDESLQTRHAIFVSWRGHFPFYNSGKIRISWWPAKGRESRYLPVFLKSVTGLAVPSCLGGYSLPCAKLGWRSMRSCGDSLMLDSVLMTVRVRNKVFIYLLSVCIHCFFLT